MQQCSFESKFEIRKLLRLICGSNGNWDCSGRFSLSRQKEDATDLKVKISTSETRRGEPKPKPVAYEKCNSGAALIYMISRAEARSEYADKHVDSWAPINGMRWNEISNKWVREVWPSNNNNNDNDKMLKRCKQCKFRTCIRCHFESGVSNSKQTNEQLLFGGQQQN